MRTASVGLTASLAAEATTLCRLLEVTRGDGTVLRFTDHDHPVTFDAQTWRADFTFTSSAVFTSATFANAQNVTLMMALGAQGVTEEDIRSKRYKRAVARIIIIDRANPAFGGLVVFKGVFGRIILSDKHRADIEIIPRSRGGFGVIGREAYSPTCRASLFDSRCGLDRTAFRVAFTVISASGNTFVAAALTQADNNWVLGQVEWLTGLNANTTAIIAASDQSSTSVTTVEAPLNAPVAGDTGYVYPGCSKMVSMCRDRYNNMNNFRGEPYVPTSNLYRGMNTAHSAIISALQVNPQHFNWTTPGSVSSQDIELHVYGSLIPVAAGRRLVTGVPIWSRGFDNSGVKWEFMVTHDPILNMSGGPDEAVGIVGTFQMGFGYHLSPAGARGRTKIVRLWADGKLVYDATDPTDVVRFKGSNDGDTVRFVLQEGSEIQISESHVTADKGPSPGNRGMITATFIAFPTGALGVGAMIPTITAELVEDINIEPTRTDWTLLDPEVFPDRRPSWIDWNDDAMYALREDPADTFSMLTFSVSAKRQISSRPLTGFTTTHDGETINRFSQDTLMVDERNNKIYASVRGIANTEPIVEIDYTLSTITKVWAEGTAALFPTTTQTTPGDGGSVPYPECGTVLHGASSDGTEHPGLLTGSLFGDACLVQIGTGTEGMAFIEKWATGGAIHSICEYPLLDMPSYAELVRGNYSGPHFSDWYFTPPGQTAVAVVCVDDKAYMSYVAFDGAGVPKHLDQHMFAHHPGYKVAYAHVDRQDNGIVLFMSLNADPFQWFAAKYDIIFQTVYNLVAILGIASFANLTDGDGFPVDLHMQGARGLLPFVRNPPAGSTTRYTWFAAIPIVPEDDHTAMAMKHNRSTNGEFAWSPFGGIAHMSLGDGSNETYDLGSETEIGNWNYWWDDVTSLIHVMAGNPSDRNPYDLSLIGSSSSTPIPLSDVLTWLAEAAGYDEDEIEVDPLITDTVLGIDIRKTYSVDQMFSDLGVVYDFQHFESGETIKFVRAATGTSFSSVTTLTTSDLAPLAEGGAGENECVITTFEPDGEAINQVSLTYTDPELNYEKNTQTYQSPSIVDGVSASALTLDIPVVMTASEAYNRVAQMVLKATEQSVRQNFRLPWKHLRLEPSDGLTLTFNGYTYAVRLDEVTINGDFSLSCLGRNYGYNAATTIDVDDYLGGLPQAVPGGNASRPMMIDAPLISAIYDTPLRAVVNTGLAALRQSGWTGGILSVTQTDPIAFEQIMRPGADVPFGLLVSDLGDSIEWNVIDETTVITIAAKSMTEEDLATAPDYASFVTGANLVCIGLPTRWEYIYFRDVTIVDAKTFQLSGLLRGRRGTEINMASHQPNDHVFLLQSTPLFQTGMQTRPTPADLLGETLIWRAKGDGEQPIIGFDITQVLTGESLRPWAPCEYHAFLQTSPLNDLVFQWQRRDRLWDDTWLGDIPMSEAVEQYDIEIFDGSTIVRTVTGLLAPSYTYTAANQATDGFTPPLTEITFRVYQISAVVGRGYATTRTVNVE